MVLSILWASINAQQLVAPPPALHGTLKFNVTNEHTLRVTIDNPPINLFDNNLLADMLAFLTSLVPTNRDTPSPKVVIFSSANPDFFIMHRDVQGIIPPLVPWKMQAIQNYISITRYLQNITTTVFLAECNGRAFGAGNEVMVQMDMRFAGPNANVGFFEDGLGVFPGGGGQQFLHDLIGKARTLEYVLGALQIDGPTGASIGWFNRHYKSAADMTRAVDDLAARISTFPNGTINATKSGLSWRNPTLDVLEADIAEFVRLDAMSDRAPLEEKFLNVTNNETATTFEMNTPLNMPELST
jgi:enoyl-CoA hydratase/carnithine racemase